MIKNTIKILLIFIIPLSIHAKIKCKVLTPGANPVKAVCDIGTGSDQTVYMAKSNVPKVFRTSTSSNMKLEIDDQVNLFTDSKMQKKVNGCNYLDLKIVKMATTKSCVQACQGAVKCSVKSNDVITSVMCLAIDGSCPGASACFLSKSISIREAVIEGSIKSPVKSNPPTSGNGTGAEK
jgi:hypothetical protein